MEFNYSYDLKISNMKLIAKKLSAKIIIQHMRGVKPENADYSIESNYSIILLGKNHKPIKGICPKIDLQREINIFNREIYLIDNSTYGHLGVKYIIVKDDKFLKNSNLIKKTILLFTIIYLFILSIGYFLAKIFLKPIIEQRHKLDNFIKDTTHELNTPISAIIMSINNKRITDKTLQRIKISVKRIAEIYNDLTYLFLYDEESRREEIESINLKVVLEKQLDYFLFLSSKKSIKMDLKLEDSYFKIEKEDFLRLVSNLISNSIKYTNRGGRITIILKENRFIIEDTGIGIKKEKQEEIFNRFRRATTITGGFGIGLNIVKNIVNRYNLKLNILSKEREGTTFIIDFR